MITVIVVYSIPVKSPKSKGLQGQKSSAIFGVCWSYGCRYPAQENVSAASKIPTVIYYDLSGKVRAVGAEAVNEGIYETAEEENWVKAEW